MVVGVLTLELYLAGANSLKQKRRILKSLLDKLKHRYNIAVAEVDQQNRWKHATVGIATVSGDLTHLNQVLDNVIRFADQQHDLEITYMQRDIF